MGNIYLGLKRLEEALQGIYETKNYSQQIKRNVCEYFKLYLYKKALNLIDPLLSFQKNLKFCYFIAYMSESIIKISYTMNVL